MYDKLSFNPGYAGLNKSICGTIIFREQWSGFDGNPTTALINVHAPVKMLRGGLGFTYVSDKLGFEINNLARLSYSYHMGLGVGDLGIGISAGILQKSIKADWITPDGTDPALDQSIAVSGANGLVPDINLGVFYLQNQLYMGISATHLYAPNITDLDVSGNEIMNFSNAKHFWITAGYEYGLGPDLKLRPSILAKSDAASTQLDININVLYKDMIWGGVSYRVSDAIAPMVGYQNNDVGGGTLRIGYAYDVTTSQIKGYSNGSHDIMVNYCFNLDKPKPLQKSKNPRFL
jgi:type IX secretion system PorP/SprF family membrane protein